MRAVVVLGLALVLAGCSSESANAQKELAILERNGASKGEICDAKRKLADAYLREHDEAAYKDADLSADITCRSASLEGSGGR